MSVTRKDDFLTKMGGWGPGALDSEKASPKREAIAWGVAPRKNLKPPGPEPSITVTSNWKVDGTGTVPAYWFYNWHITNLPFGICAICSDLKVTIRSLELFWWKKQPQLRSRFPHKKENRKTWEQHQRQVVGLVRSPLMCHLFRSGPSIPSYLIQVKKCQGCTRWCPYPNEQKLSYMDPFFLKWPKIKWVSLGNT